MLTFEFSVVRRRSNTLLHLEGRGVFGSCTKSVMRVREWGEGGCHHVKYYTFYIKMLGN